ncbi:M66 family metalloprotease [Rickettsiella endosymbiont of Xylota segnis]|uniref:M66 family metalloprotease n=1 Tax=Rickettsiella endosymbiont of Xylota segnis TaxID=3066238 RepID=UPI0030D06642
MKFNPTTETNFDKIVHTETQDYAKAFYSSEIKSENEVPLYDNNQFAKANSNQVAFNELPILNDLDGSFEARISYAQNITIYQRTIPEDRRPTLVAQRDTLIMVQPLIVPSSVISVTGKSAKGSMLGVIVLEPPENLPVVDSPDNTSIIYANNVWTGILPAEWINPGLTLIINDTDKMSTLNNIIIGAPNEVIFQTIDIGMLTTPRNKYSFADTPALHLDYYQKIPVSRLIVGEYESVHFSHVVMPDGTEYTNQSSTNGGWHEGDMRQSIAKVLISKGINFANYGLNSSDATQEGPISYVAFMITAHNARGVYANGIKVHGGSGGGGILTIENSVGNEWSHEAGHAYSLGHYPEQWRGSSHRRAIPDVTNAGWGWDRRNNRFIANFYWDKDGHQTCCGGSIPPFEGNRFNTDAMAGGVASSPLSSYTLHTPYTLSIMQNYIEQQAVFSKKSPTGFKIWNPQTLEYVNYTHYIEKDAFIISSQSQFNKIANDPDGKFIRTHLLKMGKVNILPSDGNWTRNVCLPVAEYQLEDSIVYVRSNAGYTMHIFVNNEEYLVSYRHYSVFEVKNSNWKVRVNNQNVSQNYIEATQAPGPSHLLCKDGNDYGVDFQNKTSEKIDGSISDFFTTRVPLELGVPVTTLVGYYDPDNILPSTIYPALHGGYGFVYAPTTDKELNACYLRVHTSNGIVNYQLAGGRFNENTMNKFHVNISESDRPSKAEIVVHEKIVASLTINGPNKPLGYTINGIQSDSIIKVTDKTDIYELNNSREKMASYFAKYFIVNISATENHQLSCIKLPQFAYDGQRLVITENLCSSINVLLDDERQFIVSKGESVTFIYIENSWEKEATQ